MNSYVNNLAEIDRKKRTNFPVDTLFAMYLAAHREESDLYNTTARSLRCSSQKLKRHNNFLAPGSQNRAIMERIRK